MARSGRSLADLADGAMTSLPQVLLNVPVTDRSIDAEALLASEIEAANGQLAGTGRILIRPSGTEPLIRIMVEAPSDAIALSVASSLAQALEAAAGAPAAPDHHR